MDVTQSLKTNLHIVCGTSLETQIAPTWLDADVAVDAL